MSDRLQQVLIDACRRLLRPIVRIALRHGVMYRDFAELCKEVYVEVAGTEFGLRGRPTNTSRVALLTGLDRKEVKRIRDALPDLAAEAPHRRRQDRISRVLSGWFQDPEFSVDGVPVQLPLEADGAPSFTLLVQRYGGDVAASVLLKELRRLGAVSEDAGSLRPLTRYYMPAHTDLDALRRAGDVIEDLGRTVAHNLLLPAGAPSRFEGRATNISMPAAALPDFRRFIETNGQEFLERVDAWLTEHEAPPDRDVDRCRLGIGVYWIQDADRQGA